MSQSESQPAQNNKLSTEDMFFDIFGILAGRFATGLKAKQEVNKDIEPELQAVSARLELKANIRQALAEQQTLAKDRLAKYDAQMRELKDEIENLRDEMEDTKSDAKMSEVKALRDQIYPLRDQRARAQADCDNLAERVKKADDEHKAVQSEHDQLVAKKKTILDVLKGTIVLPQMAPTSAQP